MFFFQAPEFRNWGELAILVVVAENLCGLKCGRKQRASVPELGLNNGRFGSERAILGLVVGCLFYLRRSTQKVSTPFCHHWDPHKMVATPKQVTSRSETSPFQPMSRHHAREHILNGLLSTCASRGTLPGLEAAESEPFARRTRNDDLNCWFFVDGKPPPNHWAPNHEKATSRKVF